jgi:phosphinothricin acetyltransferase
MDIRRVRRADAAAIAAIYAYYVRETIISFEDVPPDPAEMETRIAAITARYPWFVAEDDNGAIVGYAYAGPHGTRAGYRWSVDVSVYLAPDVHGRGIGRALYAVLFPELQRMGFRRAYAGITLPNAKSVGIHEAFGMTLVGVYQRVGFKHGSWWDVGWWQRDLGDDSPPADPCHPEPVEGWA